MGDTPARVVDRRYTIDREIARGGVGVILEARHEFTGRRFALKVLRKERAADATAGQRLLREARALGTLRHPNIVEIHDAGVCPHEGPYVVLELLSGATLDAILSQREQLPIEDVVAVGAAVSSALAAAHAQGILHRDVKPANVFIARGEDGSETVKVLDFGIANNAETVDPRLPGGKLTQAGSAVGTPEYMAPEQLFQGEKVDHRVDIYATAMTLFHCLTGSVPYPGTFAEIVRKIRAATEPPPVRLLRRDVSPALAAIVEMALEPRPEARPPSAAAFGAELVRSSKIEHPRTNLLGRPERSGVVAKKKKSRATISLSMAAVTDVPEEIQRRK